MDLEDNFSDDGYEEDMEDISLEAVEEDGMDSDDQMMMKRLHENKAEVIERAHLDCSDDEIENVINNDMEELLEELH